MTKKTFVCSVFALLAILQNSAVLGEDDGAVILLDELPIGDEGIINFECDTTSRMTKIMLDDSARLFAEQEGFPHYADLEQCFTKYDDDILMESQDKSWEGFIAYYESDGGLDGDFWGNQRSAFTQKEAVEYNPVFLGCGDRQYLVNERCNYSSNGAKYRGVTRVCDYRDWDMGDSLQNAAKRMLASLSFASFFAHGSYTLLGQQHVDVVVALIFYSSYLIGTRSLKTDNVVVRYLLRESPRLDVETLAEDMTRMPMDLPVDEWKDYLDNFPIQKDRNLILVCMLGLICAATNPFFMCQGLVSFVLIPIFDNEEQTLSSFVNRHYMPNLESVVEREGFPISILGRDLLLFKVFNYVISFVFAGAFYENDLGTSFAPLILDGAYLGTWLAPYVEAVTEAFTGFGQTDETLAEREDTYAGSDYCNGYSPHALWHQEAADVYFEIFALVDEVHTVLEQAEKKEDDQDETLLDKARNFFDRLGGV